MQNMKLIINKSGWLLTVAILAISVSSCHKEEKLPEATTNPTFSSVSPVEGAGGTLITVTGTGLGQISNIVFDNHNVPTTFNPVFNTETNILFRVPDTAYGGDQTIILTNTKGYQVEVPFKVIATASVASASAYEFEAGSTLTLTGNNLESVTNVVIDGTSDAATIVSATRNTLVLTMPASNVFRGKLSITNASGTVQTTQEFANLSKVFVYFKDGFGPGVEDWSWSSVHAPSNSQALLGTSSLEVKYGSGGWQGLSFRTGTLVVASDYTYMSFWIKGGTQDNNMKIYSDQGGTGIESIPVPKDVWTYYKIPIIGFLNGVSIERLNFQMRGPENNDQTVYLDNVIMVK
jgi:hypothetical protein